MNEDIRIETERLLLRPITLDDTEALCILEKRECRPQCRLALCEQLYNGAVYDNECYAMVLEEEYAYCRNQSEGSMGTKESKA